MLVGVSWARLAATALRWRRAANHARPPSHAQRTRPPDECAAAIRAALARRTGSPRATISFDDALAVICEAAGWPVGNVWVHSATGWRSSGAWHSLAASGIGAAQGAEGAADRYSGLREATAITDLGSGRGIVAAVLHLESCRFLPGLEGLGSPLRQAHAAALGLSGVVGVPVRASIDGEHKVTAILEFVTPAEVEPDGALAEALLEVAARSRRRVLRKTPLPVPAPTKSLDVKPLDVEIPDHLAG